MRAILYPYKARRALEAERDRYRETLEWISENDPDDGVVITRRRGIFGKLARLALRPAPFDANTSGAAAPSAPVEPDA